MAARLIDLDALTPEQRLRLIEDLWESLNQADVSVPLTDSQRRELDRRLDDLESAGPIGIPWEDVLYEIHRRGG